MSNTVHIVCPHCLAVNRIPTERLAENPACGKCHQSLLTGQPMEVNAVAFQKHINRGDIPVLVDFWAPWCGPCRMMAPYFTEAATQLKLRARLVKVNTEKEQAIGVQYGIRSIPTLVLFRQGREIARQAGATETGAIVRWTLNHIGP